MKQLRIGIMIVLLSLISLIPTTAQDELQAQKFLLTFVPNVQFSPLYMGIEGGYFAEHGLDISIEHLNEPDVVDLIAAGQEQFGMVSGEQVILAAANGRPVLYVYEWFQQYPVGVVMAADNMAESIADLAGSKVGLPGRFGASYSGLTTMLMAAGMSESDIQLEEIGFNAPEVFCIGAVEASVVYVNNEPLQIRNRAAQGDCGDVSDVRVLPVASAVDLVSNGIMTSPDVAENDPERVRAVVDAFDSGLQDTINNPARAYLVSLDYVEGLPADEDFVAALTVQADAVDAFLSDEPDRMAVAERRAEDFAALQAQFDSDTLIQYEVLLATIDLLDADQLGYSDLASWEAMQSTLLEMGLLDEAVDLNSIYSNDYLPE